jgi:sulfhydrogenase subunit alpha
MMNSETIKLDHIAKIEGHANLTVKLVNKKVEDANLEVFEGPRFFEAILLGRKFDEVAEMVARICGLCSVSHHITALKAVENASLHIVPSEQTELLRELLYLGEIIQDHILHLYFLALPDYLGFPSAIAMASKFPREVKRAIRLRKLGNSILGEIGGRAVHTVSAVVNGFSVLPKEKMLKSLGERLKEARSDAIKTVDLIASLKLPEFKRKTEYVALRKDDEYPFLGGYICTSSGEKILPENYRNFLREYVNPYSTAKFSTYKGKSFMVGSLARLNLNHQQLSDTAKRCLERNDLEVPSHSPFINNLRRR